MISTSKLEQVKKTGKHLMVSAFVDGKEMTWENIHAFSKEDMRRVFDALTETSLRLLHEIETK